jgi:serine/threonine protein kinase
MLNDAQVDCPRCGHRSQGDECVRCPSCGQLTNLSRTWRTTNVFQPVTRVSGNPSSDELSRRLIGRTIGAYAIDRVMGRGGMAWVFHARHEALHRSCAIKVLCPEQHYRNSNLLDFFIAEARTTSSLVHPHIVAIHNVGDLEGHHFIEMEFVSGSSLDQLIAHSPKLSIETATRYLRQASAALAAAHEAGLIHRDFKPANILIRSDGIAKLADFGLAKRVSDLRDKQDFPLTGTPPYMAPELFQGEHADKRSDVYALGVTYFNVLTGSQPYVHNSIPGLAELHLHAAVPDVRRRSPEIPEEIALFIARCLAKDPAERFPDAAVLCQELAKVFGTVRDFSAIVDSAFRGKDLPWQLEGNRLTIRVALPAGRTQLVYVEDCEPRGHTPAMIRVYSVCAPVQRSFERSSLEMNSRMADGALAIELVDGSPHFVMIDNHLRATCDPHTLRRSIFEIANHADAVEKTLTGVDLR